MKSFFNMTHHTTFSRINLIATVYRQNYKLNKLTLDFFILRSELKTLEWWISGLMLNPLFFLISRLNIACSPFILISRLIIRPRLRISHSKVFSSELLNLLRVRIHEKQGGLLGSCPPLQGGQAFLREGHALLNQASGCLAHLPPPYPSCALVV